MPDANLVILMGRVGRDPEIKTTQNGTVIANVALATTERWVQDGEKKEATNWHRVVAFGRTAEIVSQYVHKGSPLYLEGSLQTRTYEQDGQKKYIVEVKARSVQLLESRKQEDPF